MKFLLAVIVVLFSTLTIQAQDYFQVATETLNVRSSPSGKSAVVAQFTLNDSVQVIGRVGKWSKIALENGGSGYVATRFLSEEFTERREETSSESSGSSSSSFRWEYWLIGGIVLIGFWLFGGSSSGKKASPKSKSMPQRSTTQAPKAAPKASPNEDIAQVSLEGKFYNVYNTDGKRISTKGAINVSLSGHSSKLILTEEGNWYKLYDCKFKHISMKGVVKGDHVISVSLKTITIQEGVWIKTYDTNFKMLNQRAAR